MARFRSIAAAAALVLAACAPTATPGPIVVAPLPKVYTCEQQRQAARELEALLPGSVVGAMIADYRDARRKSRAALNMPDPAPCPPA